jgi:two-component system, OmpR family, sensor histidine kinase MprB
VSLRARLGIAAGVAVALAVIAVSVSAYEGTRSTLQSQLDTSIRNLAQPKLNAANGPPNTFTPQAGGPPPIARGQAPGSRADPDEGLGLDNRGPQAFGGPSGAFTVVYPNGGTYSSSSQGYSIPANAQARATAASGRGQYFTDMTVNGVHIRVLVAGIGPKGALMVALPLTDVDHTLNHELLLLIIIAAAGAALAAILGLLVARTALAPITRFTRRTESIAADPDPEKQRLEVRGRDELSRLAQTFNATLDALASSVRAQRNLVADASHELRTPIATIRANLQLMREEARLSESDRQALREDMIEELDELTALVGDVVELARGTKPGASTGEVRLDAIVEGAVERARRRAPGLQINPTLAPTLLEGDGERIARAVTNLLDNASKWSPPGGTIELTLEHGTLTVRDHGPGFHEEDLPFVFDRFHRARDARSKPGSGLGLAIVRQAAEAHGGSARAENAPDGGAIVTVSFGAPLTPEAADANAAAYAGPAPGRAAEPVARAASAEGSPAPSASQRTPSSAHRDG